MRNREKEVRASVSVENAIRRIEKYGAAYDQSHTSLDVYDQLLICEAVAESTRIVPHPANETGTKDGNVLVYENGDDGSKRVANFVLTPNKLEAISKLRKLDFKIPPPEIEGLLETIFEGCNTKPGWWLTVAQLWNPRAINRVVVQLIKLHSEGWKTFKNPAAYFTFLIKFRKKRRSL